jgi:hypothetical protein
VIIPDKFELFGQDKKEVEHQPEMIVSS